MVLRLLPLLLWLGVSAAFVLWAVGRTFYVGRMVLPKAQAAAAAIAIVVLGTLLVCWLWLGYRALGRTGGWIRAEPAWIERPALRYPLLVLLGLAPLVFVYGRYIEPRWVVVREVPLGEVREQQPVRIAVIGDLHIDGRRRPWVGLERTVNAARPDLILLLGDTLNRSTALPVLRKMLRGMRAPHGKLAVQGNWEAWYWGDLPLLEGTGFRWLHDRRTSIAIKGQTLHLVGLPYRDDATGAAAERLLSGIRAPGWRILLYHTPDLVEEVPSADLYLAGHTHGGQIALPLYGALVTLSRHGKRYERGLRRNGNTLVYVNPGIGVEPMIPLRIGVRPEVTLLTLGASGR
jgi:predicted MPP superfamily phosphohydrolase